MLISLVWKAALIHIQQYPINQGNTIYTIWVVDMFNSDMHLKPFKNVFLSFMHADCVILTENKLTICTLKRHSTNI